MAPFWDHSLLKKHGYGLRKQHGHGIGKLWVPPMTPPGNRTKDHQQLRIILTLILDMDLGQVPAKYNLSLKDI